jgi:hypothetical protein
MSSATWLSQSAKPSANLHEPSRILEKIGENSRGLADKKQL